MDFLNLKLIRLQFENFHSNMYTELKLITTNNPEIDALKSRFILLYHNIFANPCILIHYGFPYVRTFPYSNWNAHAFTAISLHILDL